MIYTTKDGDILDDIIFKYYNLQEDFILNLVIENNNFLLDYPLKYPSNLKINLLDIRQEDTQEVLNLWD